MDCITKNMTRANWEQFQARGKLFEQSLVDEGFIHCSFFDQALDTANKFFKQESDVVLLIIDPSRVKAEIKVELASNGQLYPHIYGPLNIEAVDEVIPFLKQADGTFQR